MRVRAARAARAARVAHTSPTSSTASARLTALFNILATRVAPRTADTYLVEANGAFRLAKLAQTLLVRGCATRAPTFLLALL